jgi:hypothetical protein
MTRARDIADVQDNLGGAVAPVVSGKNYIVGGGFDIWQRGTSFTSPNGVYTADRWRIDTSAAITVSQQTTGVPAGSRYCMRVAFNATTYSDLSTYIETANAVALQGKTITVQIKLRRNATMASAMGFTLQKSPTVDAGYSSGWTTITTSSVSNANLPTGTTAADWYQLTFTATIPNDGTANSIRLIGGVLDSNVSGAYWEIAQVQLEVGSAATPFARAGGSIGGELALCQRYYWRQTAGTTYTTHAFGYAYQTDSAVFLVNFPVPMRVVPSGIDYANLAIDQYGVTNFTFTALTITGVTNGTVCTLIQATGATGMTAYRSYGLLGNNSVSNYLGFSAEL